MCIPVTDLTGAADDPEMPFLVRALDPSEVQRRFESRIPQLIRNGGRIRAIRLVRHRPGPARRCLIEYDVELERSGPTTLMGKARARGTDVKAYHVQRSLWNAGFSADSEMGISVPEPVGMIPEFRMWLQHKVPGTSAARLLPEPGGVELARRIAEGAHRLHRMGVSPRRRPTRWLTSCASCMNACPSWPS